MPLTQRQQTRANYLQKQGRPVPQKLGGQGMLAKPPAASVQPTPKPGFDPAAQMAPAMQKGFQPDPNAAAPMPGSFQARSQPMRPYRPMGGEQTGVAGGDIQRPHVMPEPQSQSPFGMTPWERQGAMRDAMYMTGRDGPAPQWNPQVQGAFEQMKQQYGGNMPKPSWGGPQPQQQPMQTFLRQRQG